MQSTLYRAQAKIVLRAQTAKRLQGWQSGLMREPATTFFKRFNKKVRNFCCASPFADTFLATCLFCKKAVLIKLFAKKFLRLARIRKDARVRISSLAFRAFERENRNMSPCFQQGINIQLPRQLD